MSIRRGPTAVDHLPADAARVYDAVLVVSFGGPEGPHDVLPFLENVAQGRQIPADRLAEVAAHYERFDGVSPINAQNRALVGALRRELHANGPDLPVYLGNRNWHPFVGDVMRQMRDDGVRRATAIVTSAYGCYSACRQYREDIARAQDGVGEDAPQVDKLRVYYNHPGFIEPNVANVRRALGRIPAARRGAAPVVFTAHSIPLSMARASRYVEQLEEASRLIARRVGVSQYRLAYQSRSGPPHVAWLEPDVLDLLEDLARCGATDVVVCPSGFLSDHLEVQFDLDVEAKQRADDLGINFVRAATVGVAPAFISMIRELILERLSANPVRRALGEHGPAPDVCPLDCCLPG